MNDNFPGNPYAEKALSYPGYEDIGPAVMTLAYEQRTANLIAYLDYVTRMGMTGDALIGPYAEILQRLGIDQEVTS